MIEAGLWKPGSRKLEEVHCWRPRRSAFGELVQWDTSEHDWLEGRGQVRYLVRMIDDATSWSWGRFVERDATPHNMGVLWEYLEKNGRMVDVYTDRDSMFTVPPRAGESKAQQREADRLTQLGRALRELGIGSILALSPQAKGRVERSFLTAQDRLVKQLRLAKISTLEAANAFLEQEYWPEWNARFARPVQDYPNQHRALTPQLDLAAILCHVQQCVIYNDYTFSFAGRRHQIARTETQAGMRRQRLRAELRLDGELKARYQGRYLSIRECDTQATAVEHRRAQTGSQRSQRRRQEFLDARVLRSPQPAAMEGDRRLRWKSIMCAGQARRSSRLNAQSLRSRVSPEAERVPTGKPSRRTGPVSPEDSSRHRRACADCFRSQLRRLGFGRPRQARPRQGCANIP